jgi:hypothetical protein
MKDRLKLPLPIRKWKGRRSCFFISRIPKDCWEKPDSKKYTEEYLNEIIRRALKNVMRRKE